MPHEDEIEKAVKKHFGEAGSERIMPELREKVEEQSSEVEELRGEVRELRKKVEKIDKLGEMLESAGQLAILKEMIREAGEKVVEED
ncbi:hypothetical protein AKJ41_02075 [candidate division MSBL1 archaeon SCGC-AAA259O05]|uniref:Uncharacterized protein n=1 Tax=candidate division MSBL1 archaeon SCGC-AAA259O05 TaxID=1698271 RepID=A0A133V4E3_9EURY|nr:hypothetical protein AKJ41_02075 [candidate division MSBL1 archaeon SCGC-AAA259O05]